MQTEEIQKLEEVANQLRKDVIEELYCAGSGHPGGSLSAADILTTLYFKEMNLNPSQPEWEERDRFILSKGHACPIYYAALARRGYFHPDQLKTLRQPHSILQGHPVKGKTPGVDMSTGSLGQGLSLAGGMALYAKRMNKNFRCYCLLGDGESEEGQVWEAAMSAGHFKLNNLIAFVDANHLQIDGRVEEVMNVYPLAEKFRAFGWNTIDVDGHSIPDLIAAVETAKASEEKPTCLICHTVKGKGVSLMENRAEWHGGTVTEDVRRQALADLSREKQVVTQ